jgi:hypothetical protein
MANATGLHTTAQGRLPIATIFKPLFICMHASLKQLVKTSPQVGIGLRLSTIREVLAWLSRSEVDVAFFLDLPNAPLAAQAGSPNGLRTLASLGCCVLVPVGWGPQVRGKDWWALAVLLWLAKPTASTHP